jgi:xanthine dehydrogenase iron-sulfur cluster and FAD-binding subunit A
MSMFEGYHRDDLRELWQLADQLCGNLCRCTGYRPIRDAADATPSRARRPRPTASSLAARAARAAARATGRETGERFDRPTTLDELLALRRRTPTAVLVAGATEVGVEINKKASRFPT